MPDSRFAFSRLCKICHVSLSLHLNLNFIAVNSFLLTLLDKFALKGSRLIHCVLEPLVVQAKLLY